MLFIQIERKVSVFIVYDKITKYLEFTSFNLKSDTKKHGAARYATSFFKIIFIRHTMEMKQTALLYNVKGYRVV